MKITGVIYNELRRDISHPSRTVPELSVCSCSADTVKQETSVITLRRTSTQPGRVIEQYGNEFFCRTQIARSVSGFEPS